MALDTDNDADDPVVVSLKKLREGPGLSPDRLEGHPALLSALGTQDVSEAYELLLGHLDDLEDTERSRGLRVEFALDLEDLLGREPVERERTWLGDRRSAYAELVGRDVKTIRRWSDRTIAELRAQLTTDAFDGLILLTAGVQARRIITYQTMLYDKDDHDYSHGRTHGFENPATDATTPSQILYSFPAEWRPTELNLLVQFLGEQPEDCFVTAAKTLIDVSFGSGATPVALHDGLLRAKIPEPRWDHLYSVWWHW